MRNFIIFLVFSFSNVFASDYYNNFYSDFHNSSKTFTDQSDMIEKNFRDPDEINLPWINALVRIPLKNGDIYRGLIKNIKGENIKKNVIDFSFTENENKISLFFDRYYFQQN